MLLIFTFKLYNQNPWEPSATHRPGQSLLSLYPSIPITKVLFPALQQTICCLPFFSDPISSGSHILTQPCSTLCLSHQLMKALLGSPSAMTAREAVGQSPIHSSPTILSPQPYLQLCSTPSAMGSPSPLLPFKWVYVDPSGTDSSSFSIGLS